MRLAIDEDYFFLLGAIVVGAALIVTKSGTGSKVDQLAKAIAKAEGFYVRDSLPARANNPGDLKIASLAQSWSDGKAVFGTVDEGWAALRRQLQYILDNRSAYYQPTDTFSRIAETWTGGDNSSAWASTVTSNIGTDPQDTLLGWVQRA